MAQNEGYESDDQPLHSKSNAGAGSGKRTRATGEALAILQEEFTKNANPNVTQRKHLSELTGIPERNVRIWFQNRRAKSRKLEKQQHDLAPFATTGKYDNIPLKINNNYYFIDSGSVTVGSWKRLKSGNISHDALENIKNLANLSPRAINEIMSNATDLMVLISKKNFEINYFFSAIADSTKILFRVFFPINCVTNCSLTFETDSIRDDDEEVAAASEQCELKLSLSKSPKFAVFFSECGDTNQWSICEDFSEGRQVSAAYVGGSNIPHVLNGSEASLKFMNSLILDYNSTNQIIPPPSTTPQPPLTLTAGAPQGEFYDEFQQQLTTQFLSPEVPHDLHEIPPVHDLPEMPPVPDMHEIPHVHEQHDHVAAQPDVSDQFLHNDLLEFYQ